MDSTRNFNDVGQQPERDTRKRRNLTSLGGRSRELARIHILADELSLSRDAYEDVLWVVARVRSAAKLDDAGRRNVVAHLQRLRGQRPLPEGVAPNSLSSRPLLKKIAAQLSDAGRPWGYANAIAERLAGKSHLEFCSDEELGKVVAALAIDQKRRQRGKARA